MAKYLRLFETEAEYSAATLDYPNVSYIRETDGVIIQKEEPVPPFNYCYDVVENIAQYTATTYDEVYDKASSNWYILNNLDQYEQYGVYTDNKNTYYDGKLAVVDNHEWEYANGAWADLGEVSGGEQTIELNEQNPDLVGTSFPTTFKIAKSFCCGQYTSFNINFNDGNGSMNFNYQYYDYEGYVNVMCDFNDYTSGIQTSIPYTEDDGWYYFAPDEYTVGVPSSIVASEVYAQSDCQLPFEVVIDGGVSYIKEYQEKAAPIAIITFTSMTEANSYQGCVYFGEYANIDGSLYQMTSRGWTLQPYPPYKAIFNLEDGSVRQVPFDGDRTLRNDEVEGFKVATVSCEITDAVERIGDNIFVELRYLTSITLGNNVKTIDGGFLFDCSGVTSISFPNSVETIGYSSLYQCSGLTSVHFGSGLRFVGSNFMYGSLNALTSITVDENNTVYDSRDNCNAFIETATNKLIKGCGNTIIPNTVTSIETNAFANCKTLSSITIPSSVTSVNGFYGCSNLTSVTIENGATSITQSAFAYCNKLPSITIPSSITSIERNVFDNCNMLISITSLATTAPTVNINTFYSITPNGTLYVPSGSDYSTWMSALPSGWVKVEQ